MQIITSSDGCAEIRKGRGGWWRCILITPAGEPDAGDRLVALRTRSEVEARAWLEDQEDPMDGHAFREGRR